MNNSVLQSNSRLEFTWHCWAGSVFYLKIATSLSLVIYKSAQYYAKY